MVNVGPETTTEGEFRDVSRTDGDAWFGHPRQLARLFTTEMWERFGYYGMRALLTLYLTKHFLFSDQTTTGLYGGFTALVYLTPLIGGLLADRFLGSKKSVKFGAVMMALGYFVLCFGGETAKPAATIGGQHYAVQVENFVDRPTSTGKEQRYLVQGGQRLLIKGNEDGTVSLVAPSGQVARTLQKGEFEASGDRSMLFVLMMLIGLSLVTVGNGFFKPNISTIVGSLYEQGDRRRDADKERAEQHLAHDRERQDVADDAGPRCRLLGRHQVPEQEQHHRHRHRGARVDDQRPVGAVAHRRLAVAGKAPPIELDEAPRKHHADRRKAEAGPPADIVGEERA